MKRLMVSTLLRSSRVMRLATAVALAGQALLTAPLLAQDATKAAVQTASRAAADAKRRAAKARVRVNRTVPTVTPPSLDVAFGAEVSTAELRRVRLFPELLTPTREPSWA